MIVRAAITVQLCDAIAGIASTWNMSPEEMMASVLMEHGDHIEAFVDGDPGFLLGDRTEQVSIVVPVDVGVAIAAAAQATGRSESDLVTATLSFEGLGFAEVATTETRTAICGTNRTVSTSNLHRRRPRRGHVHQGVYPHTTALILCSPCYI